MTINVVLTDSEFDYYGLKNSIFFTVSIEYVIPEPVIEEPAQNETVEE